MSSWQTKSSVTRGITERSSDSPSQVFCHPVYTDIQMIDPSLDLMRMVCSEAIKRKLDPFKPTRHTPT